MKVLKKGTPQKGWAKKYDCSGNGNRGGGCGAKLLVEQNDVFRTASHHYDGSNEAYNTFRCPECGVWTDIPMGDVGFDVRLLDPQRDGKKSGAPLIPESDPL
jgi:hypothetical protein